MDFQEELSALHPSLLKRQAYCLNHAVLFIQKLDYSSILLVGHSMGGVVALSSIIELSYDISKVTALITLASPIMAPPVNLDVSIALFYRSMHHNWQSSLDSMKQILIVSIANGEADRMINSELTQLPAIIRNQSVSIFLNGIPELRSSHNHDGIIECSEVIKTINKVILATSLSETRMEKRLGLVKEALLFSNKFQENPDIQFYQSNTVETVLTISNIGICFLFDRF